MRGAHDSSSRPRENQKGAVGVAGAPGTPFTFSNPRRTGVFLLFAVFGLSIIAFALTPRWALERTRIFKPVVEQRPHVFMAGVTIVFLTAFAYFLGHWSP